jgi:hypothetical protein
VAPGQEKVDNPLAKGMGQILKNLTKETEEICLFKTKLSDA